MKVFAMAALVSVLVVLPTHAEEPQSAYELAPQLENLKETHPDEYRILADGTFDTLSLEERLKISGRLMIPKVDGVLETGELTTILEDSASRNVQRLADIEDPDRRARFEARLNQRILRNLKRADEMAAMMAMADLVVPVFGPDGEGPIPFGDGEGPNPADMLGPLMEANESIAQSFEEIAERMEEVVDRVFEAQRESLEEIEAAKNEALREIREARAAN